MKGIVVIDDTPYKSLIFEHHIAAYTEIREKRSTENQGFIAAIVEL